MFSECSSSASRLSIGNSSTPPPPPAPAPPAFIPTPIDVLSRRRSAAGTGVRGSGATTSESLDGAREGDSESDDGAVL